MCAPSARNASSGPYADDESPSAPRPTQARSATSEMLWWVRGSWTSRGAPNTNVLSRARRPAGSAAGAPGSGARLWGTGAPAVILRGCRAARQRGIKTVAARINAASSRRQTASRDGPMRAAAGG